MLYRKLFFVALIVVVSSCAHNHADKASHNHNCEDHCSLHKEKIQFKHCCAQSIIEGNLEAKGLEKYKIIHHGEVLYFSSEKKMNKFKNKIDSNLEEAHRLWDMQQIEERL